MPTTTRAALRYPLLTDTPDVPRDMGNLAADADAAFAMYAQGTFASRPTSTAGSPGKTGRIYYGTDTLHLYYDFGTGWSDIGPSSTAIPDGSITGGAAGAGVKIAAATITHDNIVAGTITTTEILDGTIAAADIAAALKPSGGAGSGTESLRALGTAAGTAAAGTHAAQHSRTGADPLVISTFIASGTLAARPSTSLVAGMIYTATDVNGGTTSMYNGSAWVQVAAAVSGAAAPAAHETTHLAGGTDALPWWGTITNSGALSARPTAASGNAGYNYLATDVNGGTYYVSNGSSWVQMARGINGGGAGGIATGVTAVANSGSLTNGGTWTLTSPAAGTYLILWGYGSASTGAQGTGCTITCSAVSGQCTGSDVGPSGGPGMGIGALTNGQTVTFTASMNFSSITNYWALAIRLS